MDETTCTIRRFPLVLAEYVPIVTPIDCNYYGIIKNNNKSPMWRCSDPHNPDSEYEMDAYETFAIVGAAQSAVHLYRYHKDCAVTYLMATVPDTEVVVCFFP